VTGPIYKVLRPAEWAELQETGHFAGSPDDLRDRFIHLSTEAQLPGTLQKHFAGQTDLIVLVLDPAELGAALRWEESRGGALFPHLYRDLTLAEVRVHASGVRGG